jgi:hypothetical protein
MREIALDIRMVGIEQRRAAAGSKPFRELREIAAVALERVPRQSVFEPEGVDESIEQLLVRAHPIRPCGTVQRDRCFGGCAEDRGYPGRASEDSTRPSA